MVRVWGKQGAGKELHTRKFRGLPRRKHCFVGRGQSMCIAEILDMILVVILQTIENKAREFSEVCQKH